jgi:putative ABC transport system permease protein
MLKSYFLTALRNLFKYKGFSAINIIGLSLSMTVCLLIVMVIIDQLSYDNFHTNKKRIYRVLTKDEKSEFVINRYASTAFPMAGYLRENYAQVEEAVAIHANFSYEGKYQDKIIPFGGYYTGSEFFRIFDFELTGADPEHVLDEPNSVVMREELARKFFGDEDPIGKTILVDTTKEFKVTGIIKKKNQKTHIRFEILASNNSIDKDLSDNWKDITSNYAYIILKEGGNPDELKPVFEKIREDQYGADPERDYSFSLQALTDIPLGPLLANEIGEFLPKMIFYGMTILALVLIVTAAFNYTNLSMARSLTRAKEIGVRKVLGAFRQDVFVQFLVESIVAALIALVLSYVLLQFVRPAFTGMKFMTILNVSPQENVKVYIWFFFFAIATGLIAGLVPAIYMASFNPVTIFKDTSELKIFSRVFLRKLLVVGQFIFSIILLVTIALLFRQMKYWMNADYGFNKENVLNLKLKDNDRDLLDNELGTLPEIKTIAWSSHIPGIGNYWSDNAWVDQKENKIELCHFFVDQKYIEVMGLTLLEGMNFPENIYSGKERYVILNTTAVDAFKFGSPEEALGKTIYIADTILAEVIGVVKDYNFFALFGKIKPMALRYNPDRFYVANLLISSPDISGSMNKLERIWKKIDPVHIMEAKFLDDEIREYYMFFSDILYMIGVTSVLAIIIACLGLFGMATYSTETKIKEIGVRKVFGATGISAAYLVSKGYLKLILIAIIIALPVSYFGNNLWLQNFTYRVSFGFGTLFICSFFILLLSLLIIGSQSLRAANANPAKSLRYE